MTTRGFKEEQFKQVGKWIAKVFKEDNEKVCHEVREEVRALTKQYPLPNEVE